MQNILLGKRALISVDQLSSKYKKCIIQIYVILILKIMLLREALPACKSSSCSSAPHVWFSDEVEVGFYGGIVPCISRTNRASRQCGFLSEI